VRCAYGPQWFFTGKGKIIMTISYLQQLKILSFWHTLLDTLLALILALMAPPLRPAYAAAITVNTPDDELNSDGD